MNGSHNPRDPVVPVTASSHPLLAWRRLRRGGLTLSALLVLLAMLVVLAPVRPVQAARSTRGVGTSLLAPARSSADRRLPAAATVRFLHVDVGGYKLEMVCAGQGSPTVVFEAGSGADWSTWTYVIPGLLLRPSALIHLHAPGGVQYCAYSRAGNGNSDPSPYARDSKTIVHELHTLLTRARIVGPYILVAHSMGGLYVRLYAYTYPRDVVGMVLVDSSHEDQRAPFQAIGVETCSGPGNYSRPECAAWARDQAEGDAARRARGPHPLGHMPLVVLTATGHPEGLAVWLTLQKDLATLSTNSRQLVDPLSVHFIQTDQPDFVIEALQKVVYAVRHHSQLPPVRAWRCGDGSGVCR